MKGEIEDQGNERDLTMRTENMKYRDIAFVRESLLKMNFIARQLDIKMSPKVTPKERRTNK